MWMNGPNRGSRFIICEKRKKRKDGPLPSFSSPPLLGAEMWRAKPSPQWEYRVHLPQTPAAQNVCVCACVCARERARCAHNEGMTVREEEERKRSEEGRSSIQ